MKIKWFLFLLMTSTASLTFNFVAAHGTGQSLERSVGDYFIDIGYDSLTPSPVAGEAVKFDIDFSQDLGQKPADYSDVNVSVTDPQGGSVFYGDLQHATPGPTGLLLVFPKGGSYNLSTAYKKNGQILAQASFKVTVMAADYEQPAQSPKKFWTNFISGGFAGVILTGLAVVFRDYFHRKKPTPRA